MATPSIQTLITQAQQVLNLKSSNEIRATLAAVLANANVGTPLNPNLTTQQLWDEFYEIVRQPSDDIMSIITDQMMRMVFSPPAPGGVGADKQVIFNDGGVLAGDTKFLWDKNANRLDVDGPVVITGDLTVDTSTLFVNSSNDRVGINTATPLSNLHVGSGTGLNNLGVGLSRGATTNFYEAFDGTKSFLAGTDSSQAGVKVGSLTNHPLYLVSNNTSQLDITHPGIFVFNDGAGGTRMTLNATGLGVGVTPAAGDGSGAFKAAGTGSLTANSRVGLDVRELVSGNQAGIILGAMTTENTAVIGSRTGSGNIAFQTYNGSWGERMRIDYTGNVGIGVTPSAWNSAVPALQVKGVSGVYGAGSSEFGSVQNCFYNASAAWIYGTTAAAGRYAISSGTHQWHIAPSGTAGNAITFTQAMTLDASGNLLVGKTATGFGTVGNEVKANGEVFSTQASTSNVASTYHVYSTGAAAYRFYVGMGGTVFATNTTISAISDARFKENVQDIDVGLGAILALKPRKFDWKAGKGKDIKGDRGFIAQEFETVFPNLIDEWKENAPEGEAPYKSVRQDLIPVLVKAIQELAAEVNALKNA